MEPQDHTPDPLSPAGAGHAPADLTLAAAMEAEAKRVPQQSAASLELPESSLLASPAEFAPLTAGESASRKAANIDLLLDVNLPVSIELGRTRMTIAEILELGTGSIVELDKLAGEPVDILVNNKPLAKGEVVVLDENFGVRITSLVSPRERLERLKS